ncbi:hypothetical protein [Geosporobacter ferrireducens]|uniref:hypothetical protein n=1 Tax=Geosporobacter ferrireducens TaxID=1424294 RepID=UPI00235635BC|nr:hypothetical protein [Geosporobacter ferrireducens]
MEDKIFDLLAKMYTEVQEMKVKMHDMAENMATKQDIKRLEDNMIRLENKMDDNHKALYDGYQQSMEGIHTLQSR